MELAEIHAAVAAETVGMRAAVRESESGTTVMSAAEMAVSPTEMPSPEMPPAEVVAATVAMTSPVAVPSTMTAATSAKCHTRQHGREHNDGNSNA